MLIYRVVAFTMFITGISETVSTFSHMPAKQMLMLANQRFYKKVDLPVSVELDKTNTGPTFGYSF